MQKHRCPLVGLALVFKTPLLFALGKLQRKPDYMGFMILLSRIVHVKNLNIFYLIFEGLLLEVRKKNIET